MWAEPRMADLQACCYSDPPLLVEIKNIVNHTQSCAQMNMLLQITDYMDYRDEAYHWIMELFLFFWCFLLDVCSLDEVNSVWQMGSVKLWLCFSVQSEMKIDSASSSVWNIWKFLGFNRGAACRRVNKELYFKTQVNEGNVFLNNCLCSCIVEIIFLFKMFISISFCSLFHSLKAAVKQWHAELSLPSLGFHKASKQKTMWTVFALHVCILSKEKAALWANVLSW